VWLGVPVVLLFAAFVVLVVWHRRLRRRLETARTMAAIQEEALARLGRRWDAIPAPPAITAPREHPYAADLDILGPDSLLQLVNTTTSPMGEAELGRWLLAPAAPEPARERQTAVTELGADIELCQELEAAGRRARVAAGGVSPDPEPFLAWGEQPPPGGAALRWLALISPVLFWLSLILWGVRILPWPVWVLFLLVDIALAVGLGGGAERILAPVRQQEGRVAPYGAQLSIFQRREWRAALLRRLAEAAQSGGSRAEQRLRSLSRIVAFSVPSTSLLYFPLLVLFLWNVHLATLAARWRRHDGRNVRAWLVTLGEIEALASLAALRHREPDWALPELVPDATDVTGVRLGHPLLDPAVRVDNDVRVGPPGELLLVTGSNMSGKSTLLRAIGVNAVLAGAGAPVCARSLRLPPLRLWTSMRIDDSLARGVSYFLAEVQRLKQVVDGVDAAADDPAGLVCYLLDEILQGTNTAERTTAARAVLLHLAGRRAVGACSTHDLALARDPELSRVVRNVHFQETIEGGAGGETTMTFDYLLRDGVATSTNALRLMSAMGLPADLKPPFRTEGSSSAGG
ncbi:MAG: DNA mismatch repair protein MutS, partial [Candidatus Dormibacteraeota bacterium]|nr:DNA mismatch repair protein MutS [Candidatus Dormibacteraeota bacterium]